MTLSIPRVVPPDSEFFLCAQDGDCERMKRMLCSGTASVADISAPYGLTALSMALLYNQTEVIEFLISQGASQHVPTRDWTVLDIYEHFLYASRIDYNISASATMTSYVKLTDTNWYWHNFRASERLSMLSNYRFSRLHNAVLGVSCESVQQAAIACGSTIDEPDVDGRTPLHWAALIADESMIRTLLYYGADATIADRNGVSPLHMAAATDSVSFVRALLDGGAKIEQVDRLGCAPIHWTGHVGATSALEILLDYGADVDCRDGSEEPPSYYANRGLQFETVKCLIRRGASTNSRDAWGFTAVLDAVFSDSHEALKFYLERGADVTHCLYDGKTILHVAALNSNFQTIETISRSGLSGIDVYARDNAGRVALDYMRERRDSLELWTSLKNLLRRVKYDEHNEVDFDAEEEPIVIRTLTSSSSGAQSKKEV